MDLQSYAQRMQDYYERRTDPQTDWTGAAFAENCERDYSGAKPSMRELADAICEELAGRDVLELAAGMGQYARFLARTANSVLASDATERATSRLHDGVTIGQELPPGRFQAMTLDANYPDTAPGRYSGALAVNWFQHMPREQVHDWIGRLHRVLLPKARVMVAINHLSGSNRWTLFYKPGDRNLYEARRTYTGDPVDIIDNVYSRADMMALFAPHAMQIKCVCGKAYHWVVYDRP